MTLPDNVPPAQSVVVSVLIVNYRAYSELAACLESLLPFFTDDVEVIVVDHSSEDDSAARLRQRFPWLRFIAESGNPGFATGVNRAARAAAGRYLLLLNPDCVLDSDVIHRLAEYLDAHAHVGVAGALVREADGSVQASARRFPGLTTGFAGRTSWLSRVWPTNPWTRRNLVSPDDAQDAVEVDWVSGACMMIRRAAFDAVNGMDEQFFLYWEDADLCLRIRGSGWSTVYRPSVGITHLTGRSSTRVPSEALVAFHRSAYRYFRKHSGPVARLGAPLVFLALYGRLLVKLVLLQIAKPLAR